MRTEPTDPGQFVEIASYPFPSDPELAILRIELADADIPFFEKDSSTLSLDPLLSSAIGGVKILVEEKDEAAAHEVLAEIRERLGTEPEHSERGRGVIAGLWAVILLLLAWLLWRAFGAQ